MSLNIKKITKLVSLTIVGALVFVSNINFLVNAATLPNRSLQISTSEASATNVNYRIQFDTAGNYLLGSFILEICSNTPLMAIPCVPSVGFSLNSASIISQSGTNDFVISSIPSSNQIIFSRPPSVVGPLTITIELSNIQNPQNSATHFGRLSTYSSNDGTGSIIDEGGVTFSIGNTMGLNVEVPPYLIFCVGVDIAGFDCANAVGNYIDLGELSSTYTVARTSKMLIMTNAGNGYIIFITGSNLTSGNNTIPGLINPSPPTVGQSEFGINLRANNNPLVGTDPVGSGNAVIMPRYNTPNRYTYLNGDVLAFYTGTSAEKKMTTSYMVNIHKSQKPGIYSSTIMYTALATF